MTDRVAGSELDISRESNSAATLSSTSPVRVAAPPELSAGRGAALLLPVVALAATLGMGALSWSSGAPLMRNPATLALPAMMLVSALGMLMHHRGPGGAGPDEQRRRYLEHLSAASDELSEAFARQRESLEWAHPPPSLLWALAGGPRMWRRAPGDPDFAHVRLGLATVSPCRAVDVAPSPPADRLDPVSVTALRRFVRAHAALADAPVALALGGVARLSVTGPPDRARAVLRAVICQLAFAHSPRDVLVVAVVDADGRASWEWLKWLPHNDSPTGSGPMVYDAAIRDGAGLSALLAGRGPFGSTATSPTPLVVVVADGAECEPLFDGRRVAGTTVLTIEHGPPRGRAPAVRVQIEGAGARVDTGGAVRALGAIDGLTLPDAGVCVRRLSRHHPGARPRDDDVARWRRRLALDTAVGLESPPAWPACSSRDRLRVPIGTTAQGALLELDIKEAAERGAGPHGLCVGATGSGKSELLRTIVLGMVARHRPEDLNLVLVDFKGGATFLGLDGLRHVAAVITNLADEAHLVARMKEALGGEMHRRQQVLRQAGNIGGFADYRRLALRGGTREGTLPPLPSLFVVVDEFAELLHQQPDFAELFTTIGRVGRSLGVHLLLASQRLDEGRLRGLDAHLSYRICLKTLSAADSRAVLGVADAAELPGSPGAAILRTSDGELTRFQTIYVGVNGREAPQPGSRPPVRPFTSRPEAPDPAAARPMTTGTVFDGVVARLGGRGTQARPIWLPPLRRSPELAELDGSAAGDLGAAIGLIDLPFEQRRAPLVVDLTGSGGNVAVVGAPQTGKSTTVRTLLAALAARHPARRIQFYCLDFGGGIMSDLSCLPHVGSVAGRHQQELVRRSVAQVESVLREREAAPREAPGDLYGDVVLVIDGWPAFRDQYADLEPVVTALATQGLSLGVHLIVTAGRWADIRPALKDQIGTRIELRLGDPVDSEMDRRQAALVPVNRPGCGITTEGHHFVIATAATFGVVPDGWRAPPVRLLPGLVEREAVLEAAGRSCADVVIGLRESTLQPVAMDFGRHGHLVIFGDGECGKTATLRTLCREIVRTATVQPARLFVVDFRRTLLGVVPPEHLAGYAFCAASLQDGLGALAELLQRRPASVGDTPGQPSRAGSPTEPAPPIFVIVDDYELLTTSLPDPFARLLPFLPYARDLGLHVVLARRHAGAARAVFEPFLAQLRDSGCMGLVMSGSPDEGAVIGSCRATTQPAGRGLLVTRSGSERVQVGWTPP